LNLGLAKDSPILSKPTLLWVFLRFKSPRPDGLSSSEEFAKLCEIEDALNPRIEESCRALFCGRITMQGRREFCYYAETSDGLYEAAGACFEHFPEYQFTVGSHEDSEWAVYTDHLFPPPEEMQRMGNRDVLAAMKREGDNPAIPRKVDHWLFFRAPENRSASLPSLLSKGFSIDSEYECEGESPHALAISLNQAIEQSLIDRTTIELMSLAQQFEGEYDGWQAPVTQE
jgi:regulator of RNase E activity RraB